MRVLRETAKFTRNHNAQVLISRFSPASSHKLCNSSKYAEGNYASIQNITRGNVFFLYKSPLSSRPFLGCRRLCFFTGDTTNKSEHNGAFPNQDSRGSDNIGINVVNDNVAEVVSDDVFESDSEEDLVQISDNSLDSLDTEMASCDAVGKNPTSPLYKILMKAPQCSVKNILQKWIEDGNMVDRGEVSVTLLKLQKLQLYRKALQFVEWLEATKCLNFIEHDYASHLDLVAKVHGLQQAETYINKIPESFRGEIVYRTFLSNCVSCLNVKKAVEVFNTIRDVGLPISTFSCDQLLLLYKRVDRKKVSDVLVMMEKESIKPSIFTYRLLIDLKGNSYDINGMEQIVEKMKAEGMWPDLMIQSMVVEFYIFAGLNEKAEAALKEMEGDDIKENRDACKFVLPLYASLDKASDVERVWKVCEAKPRRGESLAAIEAWGKVGCVDKAEEVFEKTLKLGNKVSSKFYDALLRIYAKNKLLFEGEDLVKRMKENGYKIGPSICDALVNLYVGVGEVNKADLILQKEARKNGIRPLHSSYVTFLKEYSKRGDVNNAENIHQKLRQAGFRNRMKLHELLLEAYLNARIPAYGFRERMKADNIFPNKKLAELLAAVDEFRMTQIAQSVELDDSLSYLFKTTVAIS